MHDEGSRMVCPSLEQGTRLTNPRKLAEHTVETDSSIAGIDMDVDKRFLNGRD